MDRTRETALPLLKQRYSENEISEVRANYEKFQSDFRKIRDDGDIINYLQDKNNETLFDLGHNVR
jgi:hypothetical protein